MEWAVKYEKTNQFAVMNEKEKVSDDELKIGSSFIIYGGRTIPPNRHIFFFRSVSHILRLPFYLSFFRLCLFTFPLLLFAMETKCKHLHTSYNRLVK